MLSNEIVDERLKKKHLRLVGDFVNTKLKIKCRCEVCGYIWDALPTNLLKKGRGCPKCSGTAPITNEIIDEKLKIGNVYRIGNYDRTSRKISVECKVCGHKWEGFAGNILRNSGCLMCARKNNAKKKSLNNEIIDERLKNNFVYRIGNYVASRLHIEFGCKKCGHIWKAKPNNILNGRGCPYCSYGKNEKLVYDFLKPFFNEHQLLYQKRNYYKNGHFVFDFFINSKLVIEYNGIQHYKVVEFFGGREKFKEQKNRDKKLRKHCKKKGYQLLEIPYTMKEEEWKAKILEFLSQHVSLENPIHQSA